MSSYTTIDYWNMTDDELRSHWHDVSQVNFNTDFDGTETERLNFVEDAILQRIGAPEHASGDEPEWQARIRAFGETA